MVKELMGHRAAEWALITGADDPFINSEQSQTLDRLSQATLCRRSWRSSWAWWTR